jgi:hypothetical protein
MSNALTLSSGWESGLGLKLGLGRVRDFSGLGSKLGLELGLGRFLRVRVPLRVRLTLEVSQGQGHTYGWVYFLLMRATEV